MCLRLPCQAVIPTYGFTGPSHFKFQGHMRTKKQEGNFATMSSPMKPLIIPLAVLSFFLGNVIDINKLKKSDGFIFERSRFSILKFLMLIGSTIGAFVFFGAICILENIR